MIQQRSKYGFRFYQGEAFMVGLLLMLSCKSPRFVYCDVSKQFITDTLVESSNCKYYYDPFIGKKDTIIVYTGTKTAEILSVVRKTKNGYSYFDVYTKRHILYIRGYMKDGKLNGICKSYYLPDGNNVSQVAEFKNNRMNGFYYYLHPGGDTLEKKLYKNGKLLKNYKIE